ncbi:histidinol dehydrogenase, partial [Candidatus Bathyarchaeota archaeon]
MNRAPKELLEGRWPSKRRLDPKLRAYVSKIIDDVKRRGDEALIEFTKRFDGVELEPNEIRVSEEEIEEAYNRVRGEEISAVKLAKERLERLEKLTLERLNLKVEGENLMVYRRVTPIRSVGCYIPGGEASYPSTVMMAVVPARVAGVPRIAICTPPRRDGGIEP